MTRTFTGIICFIGLSLSICKGYGQANSLQEGSLLDTFAAANIDTINKEQAAHEPTPVSSNTNKTGFLNLADLSKWLHAKTHKDTGLAIPADTVASAPFAFA